MHPSLKSNFIFQSLIGVSMKKLLFLFCCLAALSFTTWQPDFEKARSLAKDQHQLILLNFSGSDWCGPCIRMHREIFGNDVFAAMADSNLVMVNADFPRNKKNQLDKQRQKNNDALADKYNPEGKFPFTLLMDADGKILQTWDGLPKEDVETFTQSIKKQCDAYAKR